jgi:hypothetical protein
VPVFVVFIMTVLRVPRLRASVRYCGAITGVAKLVLRPPRGALRGQPKAVEKIFIEKILD